MPPPIATAGRGTRGRAGTAWQSVIVTQSARRPVGLSTPHWSREPERARSLATPSVGVYDRSSMIGVANVKASRAGIASFAIIAPSAR